MKATPWWRRRLALASVRAAENCERWAHRWIRCAGRLAPLEMGIAWAMSDLETQLQMTAARQPRDYPDEEDC